MTAKKLSRLGKLLGLIGSERAGRDFSTLSSVVMAATGEGGGAAAAGASAGAPRAVAAAPSGAVGPTSGLFRVVVGVALTLLYITQVVVRFFVLIMKQI